MSRAKIILTDNTVPLSKIIDKIRVEIAEHKEHSDAAFTSFAVIPKLKFESIMALLEDKPCEMKEDKYWGLAARLDMEGFNVEKLLPDLVKNPNIFNIGEFLSHSHLETNLTLAIKATAPSELCTLITNGRSYIAQPWYNCRTCGMTGGTGMCKTCAELCHTDHDCYYSYDSSGCYCDCHDHNKCQFDPALGKDGQKIGKEATEKLLKDLTEKFSIIVDSESKKEKQELKSTESPSKIND